MIFKNIFRAIVVVISVMCLSACKANREKAHSGIQACRTIVAKLSTLENKWYYVGEIEAKTSTGVGFKVPGTVVRVYVDEGDYVKKGSCLPSSTRRTWRIATI